MIVNDDQTNLSQNDIYKENQDNFDYYETIITGFRMQFDPKANEQLQKIRESEEIRKFV